MKVTVENVESEQPREFLPGQVYRDGSIGNFSLIISKTEFVDLGSSTHGYIQGPQPLSKMSPSVTRVPSGSKLTFEVV